MQMPSNHLQGMQVCIRKHTLSEFHCAYKDSAQHQLYFFVCLAGYQIVVALLISSR